MINAEIIEGVVIGFSSGVILSLFFGGMGYVNKYIKRRNQIRYFAQLILKYRALIHNAKGTYFAKEVQRSEFCKAYYEDMTRQLDSTLTNRSSRLSYDEIKEVRDVFDTDLFPGVVLNDRGYDNIFDGQESIKWLKRPYSFCGEESGLVEKNDPELKKSGHVPPSMIESARNPRHFGLR